MIVQVIGAILAALTIWAITSGRAGFDLKVDGLAANGYGENSPGGFNLTAGLITEIVMTAGFLFVILGTTAKKAVGAAAPMAIGFALVLIHLISIPVTNTSVNPRSFNWSRSCAGRLGDRPVVAVLGRSDYWSGYRRFGVAIP